MGDLPLRRATGLRGILEAIREFTYGMSGYEFARHAMESRAALENIFMVTLVGDMLGPTTRWACCRMSSPRSRRGSGA